jgi:hypothetical protein
MRVAPQTNYQMLSDTELAAVMGVGGYQPWSVVATPVGAAYM